MRTRGPVPPDPDRPADPDGLAALLPVAMAAVDLGAELLRGGRPGTLTAKGDRDMASEVDFAVERAVRERLGRETPGIGFLGEEEGPRDAGAELVWVLDPVDGTVNFVHGIPLVAVSLGLLRAGRPVLGVIDVPLLGERYWAVEGAGAYADGERLTASRPAGLGEAVVALGDYAVGTGAAALNRERLAMTAALVPRAQRLRMLGTAAVDLAWLAAGRLDALVMFSNKPWDVAAGVVLAREAGARVVDRDGSEHGLAATATIAATSPVLDEILALVPAPTPPAC
ncbi:inositol monophosphatase family protein [Micromonospora sp. NPDC049559]|uniref:inositol monophosphatase family protein n=1 Tax=Micromonospora sp. NPDC049559 TaxID=3155923 RepID=UPI00343F4EDA